MSNFSDQLKKQLGNVFSGAGTSMVLTPRTVSSTDQFGKNTYTSGTASTTNMLIYNLTKADKQYFDWGTIGENEMDVMIPATLTPGKDDLITYSGVDYYIKKLDQYVASGVTIAWVVRVGKHIA